MTWRHIFTESIAALRFHRQRSIFTTLSLAWGVTCFVILISYGDGFERALVKAFTAVGQNLVLTIGGQTSEQAGDCDPAGGYGWSMRTPTSSRSLFLWWTSFRPKS
ncbi:MAG: ABC transporter permease [Bryobacterales bacterium]|nr:ABC transporter permease [Bryobacterales bacterium]